MTPSIDRFLDQVEKLESELSVVWPYGRYAPCIPGTGVHFSLLGTTRPVSVSRAEGRALLFIAHLCKVRTAFEIGTAFGYSSLMLAAGVRSIAPNGWVCSLDAQLEGELGYRGLAFAQHWRNRLELGEILHFETGRSPEDVERVVGYRQIELAFIDGNHRREQPTIDFHALLPFLAEHSIIVWHDVHETYGVPAAMTQAEHYGFKSMLFETSCRLGVSCRNSEMLKLSEEALSLAISAAGKYGGET